MAVRPSLVLVGGGHAHALVLLALARAPRPDVHVTVVLDRAESLYSGMFPGLLSGRYHLDDLTIDVRRLARAIGADVVARPADRIDATQRMIHVNGAPPVPYDVASVDVGSRLAGLDRPGVAEHAWRTRPLASFAQDHRPVDGPLVVAGGGAAGVEIAFCLHHRYGCPTTLIDAQPTPLPHTPALGAAVRRAAGDRGVSLVHGRVAAVGADRVTLDDGRTLPAARTVWATGAAPHPWLAASGLPAGRGGFIAVDRCLRVTGAGPLFAAGDCADVDGRFLARAGVYAVRAAPILAYNLLATLDERPLRAWHPQRDFLALLDLGPDALAHKWGMTWQSAAVLRWKTSIDARFMRMLRDPPMSAPMPAEACGGCAAKADRDALRAALVAAGLPDRDEDAGSLGDDTIASIDAFPALTGDPWLDGRLAATHALGDVYARGARPRAAMISVLLPRDRPTGHVLPRTLAGVRAALAGVPVANGHTALAAEASVTVAVVGADMRWSNAGARPGDRLLLTHPLGSGVLWHADMRGLARGAAIDAWIAALPDLAGLIAAIAAEDVHAATDVTGFGLGGHAAAIARASGVDLVLDPDAVPRLPEAVRLLEQGVRTPIHVSNEALLGPDAPPALRGLLADPQSVGGLLLAVPADRAAAVLAVAQRFAPEARLIGEVRATSGPTPTVRWLDPR